MFRSLRTIRSATFSAAFAAAAVSGACGRDDGDLQAAQRDSSLVTTSTVTTPLNDAPLPTPTPATANRPRTKSTPPRTSGVTPPASIPPSTPPTVPVSVAPVYGEIPVGAEFAVRPTTKVCTNTQKVGERVTATVTEPASGSNGTSIPAGATATLEVTKSVVGENDEKKAAIDFRVVSVAFDGRTYDIDGSEVTPRFTTVRRQSTGDQAKKVAIGAAAGAVVGRVIGKDTKSTVVGGAIGAIGGAAAAAGTSDYDACVSADSRIAVSLTKELRVRVN
jgi:hypothetical protein